MDNWSYLKKLPSQFGKTNLLLDIKYEKNCYLQEETKISAYFKNLLAYKHLRVFMSLSTYR